MRIALGLGLLSAALSACSMDSTSPSMPLRLHAIVAYEVESDGSLEAIDGGVTGLADTANGLAAR